MNKLSWIICTILFFYLTSFFLVKSEASKKYHEYKIGSEVLKPGIKRHYVENLNKQRPIVANVLEIDLSNENIRIKVGMPDEINIMSKDVLTNIVANEMAFIGINANYFDLDFGNPIGTLITGGKWVVGPVYDRVAVGFRDNKSADVDRIMLLGSAIVYRGFNKKVFARFEINGLNIPSKYFSGVGLYTPDWGKEFLLPDNKIGIAVKNGCIREIKKNSIEILSDDYVLVGDYDYVLGFLKENDCLEINWRSDPDWLNVTEAVSGGPYLIKDSLIFVDELEQNIKFAQKDTYAPRTAIGFGGDDKLYLVVVDGRRPGYSVGMTLRELAELLLRFKVTEAINLDGGGSSTLVVDNIVVNKPSGNEERKISNALLVFYEN